ncbi:MAG: DUF4910 domain-containing protein [Gammaproteobacteria bacterium]
MTDLAQLADEVGAEMYALIERLYPICRSITGDGVRKTLDIIKEQIPIEIHEVRSGTAVFDWTVPKEWNINDGWIKTISGEKVVDFKECNLHVLNYSVPVQRKVSLNELKTHIFTLPDKPDWIPYRTSYYQENWGFCMSHAEFEKLQATQYEVFIDSELKDGYLSYGEYYKRGESEDEVLLSCHVCHPSLCNDNLSGIALAVQLAKVLEKTHTHYSYRILFIPGTIGSITWLSLNEQKVNNIKHGLVVVCVGDNGKFTYKKSRQDNSEIDKIVLNILNRTESDYNVIEFYPYGYDERQYCSPGFDLPVGSLSRSTHGAYPEYHTSADDLSLVKAESLNESYRKYLLVLDAVENNASYLNLNPKCEPQLGKRGLYNNVGAKKDKPVDTMAMLWVLNLSDGNHSLLDISERSGYTFDDIKRAAHALQKANLLRQV